MPPVDDQDQVGSSTGPTETPTVEQRLTEIWDRHQAERDSAENQDTRGDTSRPADRTDTPAGTTQDDRARDEQGRFVKAAGDDLKGSTPADQTQPGAKPAPAAATDQKTQQPTTATEGQGQKPQAQSRAPAAWTAEEKAQFDSLPEEARGLILKHYNGMQTDYTRKTQALAEERRRYESLTPAIAPIEAEAQRYGVPTDVAIKGLWQAHQALLDPQTRMQAIKRIADDYDIDLTQAATIQLPPRHQATALDPEIDTRLKRIEDHIGNASTQAREAAVRSDAQQINAWIREQSEDGTPRRPHVETVLPRMMRIVPVLREANPDMPVLDLMQEAYDAACTADPVIRQRLIDDQVSRRMAQETASRTETAERERGQKAAAASSTTIARRGGTVRSANGDARNVDATLDRIYSKHMGAS